MAWKGRSGNTLDDSLRLTDPFVITPASMEASTGTPHLTANNGGYASAVWVAASRAIFVPFIVNGSFTVRKMALFNGAVVSGNLDIGIYDAAFNRLVSSGSVAQAGINVLQEVDIADTVLQPGWYYLAAVLDNITGTTLRTSAAPYLQLDRVLGIFQQTAAFPLPGTATPEALAAAYLPIVAISSKVSFV